MNFVQKTYVTYKQKGDKMSKIIVGHKPKDVVAYIRKHHISRRAIFIEWFYSYTLGHIRPGRKSLREYQEEQFSWEDWALDCLAEDWDEEIEFIN